MIKLKGEKNTEMERVFNKALGVPPKEEKSIRQTEEMSTDGIMHEYLKMPSFQPKKKAKKKRKQVLIQGKTQPSNKLGESSSDDDSGVDVEDDESALDIIRAKRIAMLKSQAAQAKKLTAGEYLEISQPDFIETVTATHFVICHFYSRQFQRCEIVHKHLALLAAKYRDVGFCRIEAEKCPFFATKLGVRVLPTMVIFKDGGAVDRIVGFDELGATDEFETIVLEERLAKAKVIPKPAGSRNEDEVHGPQNSIRSGFNNESLDGLDEEFDALFD